MSKTLQKIAILWAIGILLALAAKPKSAYAQWPPFSFGLTPFYENGKITYTIKFSKKVDDVLADVVFKIPLPKGTQFLEANAQPTTSVDFDGAEITFFTATLHQPISNASFTVEVIDPAQTTITTQAWIAWKGNTPGNYLMNETVLDLTKQPLNWAKPESRLTVEAKAEVNGDIVTYTLYPKKRTDRRMWDVHIRVPVPEGTTLVSMEAPAPFVTHFDGWEASFTIIEMDRRRDTGPLIIKISISEVTDPFVITHAWATWKNVGRSVGRRVAFVEEARTGDIIVQPNKAQHVVADAIGDTPFNNYDLTGIALQRNSSALQINYYAVVDFEPIGEPLEYIVYIDADCDIETGGKRGNRGAEYWVRYKHENGKAYIYNWDSTENTWGNRQSIGIDGPVGKMISVSIPMEYLDVGQQICWLGRVWNRSDEYSPAPPNEWVGSDSRLTIYEGIGNFIIESTSGPANIGQR